MNGHFRARTCLLLNVVGFCILAFLVPPAEAAHHRAKTHSAHPTKYGLASYYGKGLQGKKTADGEKFDKNEISAAHPTYPLGTRLRVTNLRNGRAVNVRINDRGPARKHRAKGVIIDLSERAATELGFRRKGKTRVKTEVLAWGPAKTHKKRAAAAPAT